MESFILKVARGAEVVIEKAKRRAGWTGAPTLSWDAVDGAKAYRVYCADQDAGMGFLAEVEVNEFEDDTQAIPDTEEVPPDFQSPFRRTKWPSASAHHQQRHIFAGTTSDPEKFYGSRVGGLKDFGKHSIPKAGDAFEHTIASAEATAIKGLGTLGQLILYTDGCVWLASGDSDGAITHSDVRLQRVSQSGAANLKPLGVGTAVLNLQARKSLVREFAYDLQRGGFGGFNGRDATIYSSHLVDGYTIKNWAYAEAPDSVVWLCRSDGALLGYTRLTEEEIAAWHQHSTDGTDKFLSVASIPELDPGGLSVDVVYAVVKRTIDGVEKRYIERMVPRTPGVTGYDQRADAVYLDSALTYNGTNTDGATTMSITAGGSTWLAGEDDLTLTAVGGTPFPGDNSNEGNGYRLVNSLGDEAEFQVQVGGDSGSTTAQTVTALTDVPASLRTGAATAASTTSWVKMVDSISGLSHLEGRTVSVLADGHELVQQVVSDTGTLPDKLKSFSDGSTERPYGIVHVGLPYTSEIKTMDLDFSKTLDAVLDKQKRVNGVTLFVDSSRPLKAGIDESGVTLYEQNPAVGYTVPDLVTDKVFVGVQSRWTNHGRVHIKHTSPYPMSLRAMITHFELGGR